MLDDYSTLIEFNKKPVSDDMVQYLVNLTSKLIKIPTNKTCNTSAPNLSTFIKRLIVQSNVHTSTLMATAVYLARLKNIIAKDAYGMESTRHRIFLGCLILVSKTLNDTSPKNKYWAEYTGGLLNIQEVNTIERELLEYFKWDIRIETNDLLKSLKPLLDKHKIEMMKEKEKTNLLYFNAPLAVSPRKKPFYVNNNLPEEIKHKRRSTSQVSIPSISSNSIKSSFGNVDLIFEKEELSNPYTIPLTGSFIIESPRKNDSITISNKGQPNWPISFKKSNYLKTDKFVKFKNSLLKKT